MNPHVTFITLGVEDLNRSAAFYETGLGWPRSEMSTETLVLFELDGVLLGLYAREALADDVGIPPAGTGFRGFTLSHNVDSPDAVDAALDEAVAAGADLIKPGQDVFWGGYSGYFADPDGFYWEVAWNPYL
ncbi:MAG: VOC family protein [Bacteroidetes bacterium]|jgi:catechol 2,3-dioxygenase-like lactoylglutathione lyase family enzyme|nr:VOC family protein [Bacteroidota bacterium]